MQYSTAIIHAHPTDKIVLWRAPVSTPSVVLANVSLWKMSHLANTLGYPQRNNTRFRSFSGPETSKTMDSAPPPPLQQCSHSCGKEGLAQWLNNYKDTKPSMSSLLVFNRVYRLEIQSVMLVFSARFVNNCPCNLLSGYLPPPPFPVWTSILYTRIHCVRGWGHGVKGWEGASDR